MEINEILRSTRYESGKSQEFMALELGVARRTIQNWESGVSEPGISQAINWFQVIGKNPIPFLLQYLFPIMDNISAKDDMDKLRRALSRLIQELPDEGVRELLYLLYGDHGSSPVAVLNLMTAHLQTPMKDRVIHGEIIAKNYEIAKLKGTLAKPDHIQPNVELLRSAIALGEKAYLCDEKEYMIRHV